ncbi:MAG: methylamine dehydrogenase accessory protein MauD [Pseudomonadota bacterium]
MVNALIISNIILWIAVVALGLMVFALTRQIGVLYERVAPAGALMMNKKLSPGEPAPALEVVDINGQLTSVGGVSKTNRSQLLFFISPTCPVCKTLLPVVKSAGKSEDDWLEVILASDGEEAEHREYIKTHELENYTYVSSELLGVNYGVSKLPYAVLIDEAGNLVTMGIINSREHLESLFESKELGVPSIQAYFEKTTVNVQENNSNELV